MYLVLTYVDDVRPKTTPRQTVREGKCMYIIKNVFRSNVPYHY